MATVHPDSGRDFAMRVLRASAAIAGAFLIGGCSFGLFGGARESSLEKKAETAPDEFQRTHAGMTASPREPFWPFHLAELYHAADSSAVATTHLHAALAIDPDYAPALSLLSKIYYDAGLHAQAVGLLEPYVARHPDAPAALRASLALHCEALGDGPKADAALQNLPADAPDVQGARVLATLRHNDAAAMMDAAKKALANNDRSAANHNNHGIALLVAGRPGDARDAFRTALKIDDALPGALYNMAIVESFYFFNDDAGRDWYARYRQVATVDPDNLAAHFEASVSTTKPGKQ